MGRSAGFALGDLGEVGGLGIERRLGRAWWVRGLALLAACLLAACTNSPYPDGSERSNTLFYTFSERSPRYLDPVASYSNPESAYTYQIYEPLYGYHYLKRPYVLTPKAAAKVVQPHYLDKDGQPLPDDAPAGSVDQETGEELPVAPRPPRPPAGRAEAAGWRSRSRRGLLLIALFGTAGQDSGFTSESSPPLAYMSRPNSHLFGAWG